MLCDHSPCTYSPLTILIGFVGNWFTVNFGESVHGGLLFGFFFIAAPGGGIVMPANHGRDFEAFAVVRSFFVEQFVERSSAELALGHLLQQGFEVAPVGFL